MNQLEILNSLHAEVASETSVIASAVALINNLKARLQAALEAGTHDPSALVISVNDIVTTLHSNTDDLAKAVAANTIADPTTSTSLPPDVGSATTGAAPATTDVGTLTTSDTAAVEKDPLDSNASQGTGAQVEGTSPTGGTTGAGASPADSSGTSSASSDAPQP